MADYVSVYCFLLQFLRGLEIKSSSEERKEPESDKYLPTDAKMKAEDTPTKIRIILGGYSYGSLIASHLPTIEAVTDLFKEICVGSALYRICTVAEAITIRLKNTLGKRMTTRISQESLSFSGEGDSSFRGFSDTVSTSYLLISPILPPLSQFLTVFSTLSLIIESERSTQAKYIPCPEPNDQLRSHRTLAIYGNQDGFTSAQKLDKWSDALVHGSHSEFQSREIDGAGHFWREDGVEMQAKRVLKDWLAHGQ